MFFLGTSVQITLTHQIDAFCLDDSLMSFPGSSFPPHRHAKSIRFSFRFRMWSPKRKHAYWSDLFASFQKLWATDFNCGDFFSLVV